MRYFLSRGSFVGLSPFQVLSKLEIGDHEKIMTLLQELLDNPEYVVVHWLLPRCREISQDTFRYADNAKRMSQMLAKKPFSSKDTLLRYVDFAAEFGEIHSFPLQLCKKKQL